MAFEDNIKQVSVQLGQIKTYTPAVRVGNKIVAAGIGGDFIPGGLVGQPYVVVSDSGQLKVQKLSFDQTTPQDQGQTQDLGAVKVFQTGHPQPEGGDAVEAVAGYAVNIDGQLFFHSLQDSSSQSIPQLKIVDTGVQEPQYAGGGSSMNFYKCSYINSDSWGGYKAVLSNDVYSFESNSTHDLRYTVTTPQVGNIYSQNALVQIKSLYTGVFQDWDLYFPLTSAAEEVTGSSLTNSNVTFTSQSAIFGGNATLTAPQACYEKFNSISSLFVCGWFKLSTIPNDYYTLWDAGSEGTKFCTFITNQDLDAGSYSTSAWGTDLKLACTPDYNWHFWAFYTKALGNQYICLDNTVIQADTAQVFTSDTMSHLLIGKRVTNVAFFVGEMARLGFKFNESLSLGDFTSRCGGLRSEFTPSN